MSFSVFGIALNRSAEDWGCARASADCLCRSLFQVEYQMAALSKFAVRYAVAIKFFTSQLHTANKVLAGLGAVGLDHYVAARVVLLVKMQCNLVEYGRGERIVWFARAVGIHAYH